MILEKLSNKVNPKKKYIDSPGKSKQTRFPDKIGSFGVGGEWRVKGEEEGKKGMEENLRE